MADKNNLFCSNWFFETSVGITIYDYIIKENRRSIERRSWGANNREN